MAKIANIAGFRIEAEHDEFGMSQVSITKGRFWSSLPALEDRGFLVNDRCDSELDVPQSIVLRIAAWADANGF